MFSYEASQASKERESLRTSYVNVCSNMKESLKESDVLQRSIAVY